MKILIAEDEAVSRRLLEATLKKLGYDVITTTDGREALQELSKDDAPKLAIIDWMMPNLDGLEVCMELNKRKDPEPVYVILLTARGSKEDIVTGLNSGADDYITKPFNREELLARVNVGQRIVDLQRSLSQRVYELEEALNEVKQLQGMLPICSYCKKVRDDNNYWQQVEEYLTDRSEAKFSHSVCPDCDEKYVKPQLERLAKRLETSEKE
ncbi:response regulator transcription factor [bacterium]|nr:response regulator transcription factor [bacterium]